MSTIRFPWSLLLILFNLQYGATLGFGRKRTYATSSTLLSHPSTTPTLISYPPSDSRPVFYTSSSSSTPLSQRWYREKQKHLSTNQRRTLARLWPKFGLDLKFNSSLSEHANHSNDYANMYTILDIGFGHGDSLVGMVRRQQTQVAHAQNDNSRKVQFIGCEIHRAGIASALEGLESIYKCDNNDNDNENNNNNSNDNNDNDNVLIIRADVGLLLLNSCYLPDLSLDEVCVYFPDPWPAGRDAGRRVIRPDIVNALSKKLKNNGLLRMATDVGDYASHIRNTIACFNDSVGMHGKGGIYHLVRDEMHPPCVGLPYYRDVTLYEKKAKEKSGDQQIHELEYKLVKGERNSLI